MSNENHPITPDTMLPDLLRAYPEARSVLDRYGLRGCGGPFGPAETLSYFARAHGVDLETLLREIRSAGSSPVSTLNAEPDATQRLADAIYRRFFKAGVFVVLTPGALWGALLLLKIGFSHRFTAVSIHEVNAHGHAQIFGWVGLFVMGFAYQAFPRIKHTHLWRPDLANATFYMMVFGIFARAVGEPLFHLPMMRGLALSATVVEIAAIGLFIVILLQTFRLSGHPRESHDAYIIASLLFFLLQAVYDFGLLHATTSAVDRTELLRVVSTYQAPLRDLQIHGFALLMILGVGIRMFPALFGFHQPREKVVWVCLVAIVAGIAMECAGFILMRGTGHHGWAGLMYAGMLALAVASVWITFRWGLLARPAQPDRSTKFVRVGVAWLHVSMTLLVLLPVYLRVTLPGAETLSVTGREALDMGFSHAYYGAVRHAITVGFISLTIMGMAAKVVPTLCGVEPARLPSLWLPFGLINVGCLMRVGFQIATDFREAAYPLAGVSGMLEVTALAIWGVHLWRIMAREPSDEEIRLNRPARITPEHPIGYVVEWFPETLPLLIDKGFTPLKNPVLRRTMARTVSVRMAAAQHRLNLDALLAELNAAAFQRPPELQPPSAEGSLLSLPVMAG